MGKRNVSLWLPKFSVAHFHIFLIDILPITGRTNHDECCPSLVSKIKQKKNPHIEKAEKIITFQLQSSFLVDKGLVPLLFAMQKEWKT